jgi:arylsulfatase A-like enzyme
LKVPGVTTPGTQTHSLGSHVDLAASIAGLAGANLSDWPSVKGRDMAPVFADPQAVIRDHVLFAMDSAHTPAINQTRYAVRGFFDGQHKYARYYGVGGGLPSAGLWGKPRGHKLYDVDADFDDQDHEWYDHAADPGEMVNLANDRSRRDQAREQYHRLLRYEAEDFTTE